MLIGLSFKAALKLRRALNRNRLSSLNLWRVISLRRAKKFCPLLKDFLSDNEKSLFHFEIPLDSIGKKLTDPTTAKSC